MIKNPDNHLHIFMLNVGQGDTTIIISPKGKVAVIDAMRATKVKDLLKQMGNDGKIEHLVVTHPHDDHFGGCNSLAGKTKELKIKKATLAPFWYPFGLGPKTYQGLISKLKNQGTNINFLSGLSRWYPDYVIKDPTAKYPVIDENAPFLELLGPSNSFVRKLKDANVFNTNHLSIMCRFTWRKFRMVIAGDAQMENWAHFDDERLLEKKCQVLRSAHHGSMNGTQWERINRLKARTIIISSNPDKGEKLPDVVGSSIFTKFNNFDDKLASITKHTGTIYLKVSEDDAKKANQEGILKFRMMNDKDPDRNAKLDNSKDLNKIENPTNWVFLLEKRTKEFTAIE